MDENKKAAVRKVVTHFKGSQLPVTQDLLTEFCNKENIESIVLSDFNDYLYQVEIDEKMVKIFPELLAICAKYMAYIPEFASKKEHDAQDTARLDAKEEMVKLLEKYEMDYHFADHAMKEFARIVAGTIESAGTVANNKAMQVMLHLTREHFKGHLHMGNVKEYAEAVFEK